MHKIPPALTGGPAAPAKAGDKPVAVRSASAARSAPPIRDELTAPRAGLIPALLLAA